MDSSEGDMTLGDYSYSVDNSLVYNETVNRINNLAKEVLNSTWDNVLLLLSDWQKGELANIDSESGIRCLLGTWFNKRNIRLEIGDYCNVTWDGVYCWPSTPLGTKVKRSCSEIFQDFQLQYRTNLEEEVTRVCSENGTWLGENPVNYEICSSSNRILDDNGERKGSFVTYMVFVGSILSLFCLTIALTIFYCYKNLRTQRFIVHIHLMLALLLRFILLYIITEPFVFNRQTTYRDYDLVCKSVILAYLYSTVVSVMWMLVQGMHLNAKLTTNVLTGESHKKFRFYYILGWVFPAIILIVYLTAMMIREHKEECWRGYSDMIEIWIILTPIIVALVMNVLYLLSILRVVTRKTQCPNTRAERSNLVAVTKATLVLFPVLGLNNLLLVYNPGGVFEKYFVSLNTFFGSTQGIFVSVVFCFMSKEVQQAILRSYNRFMSQRSARVIRSGTQRKQYSLTSANNTAAALDDVLDETHVV